MGWKAAKQGWTKARSHTSEALKTAQKAGCLLALAGQNMISISLLPPFFEDLRSQDVEPVGFISWIH